MKVLRSYSLRVSEVMYDIPDLLIIFFNLGLKKTSKRVLAFESSWAFIPSIINSHKKNSYDGKGQILIIYRL